jgi:hypothetical protein
VDRPEGKRIGMTLIAANFEAGDKGHFVYAALVAA